MTKTRFLSKLNLLNLLYTFMLFQIVNISTFLLTRSDQIKFNFDIYLNFIKYTTLLMSLYAVLLLISDIRIIKRKFNLLTISTSGLILALYFTMIIHTDKLALFSPTIFLMLVIFVIYSVKLINFQDLLKVVFLLTMSNSLFVLLQIFNFIPVAQENIRESVFDIGNRPTGIFFNAFAMGYAMSICFIIFSYQLIKKNINLINVLGSIFSLVSLNFSGTRTSLVLSLILIFLLFIFFKINSKNIIPILTFIFTFVVASTPFFIIGIGNFFNIGSLSGLNGRTQLWSCVLNKWESFLPFGVGVQAAFPQGFCSDDVWFSRLRHPENMFLLTYVEAGIVGLLTLVGFFIVVFYISNNAIKKGNYLPWAISNIFLLSSLFYVPLFHYLPFLPNRTADRGVFNFFLITLIWVVILKISLEDNQSSSYPKSKNSK